MHFSALYKPSGSLTFQPFLSSVVGVLRMDDKEVGPLWVPIGLQGPQK